ncbi:MAG: VCBS repeat-containing protein, partial [Chitinophagaceae bacterium]|nr:VCBS repeat-containing protein [Chitinophagaceae bacterium]
SNMGENKLYLNKRDWTFEDITAKSGMKQDSMWSTGIVMADVNNDGWLDMYVCNSGNMTNGNRRNKLYINNHNLTFTESAKEYGLDISCYATQASFFDYDLDGDLDCFLIANSPMPINTFGYINKRNLPAEEWPVEKFVRDGGDHLYRNDNGKFVEVSKEAGIHGTLMSFGLGVSVGDVNNDGYPDIYVSNDSYERDYLYINQKDGTFSDDLEKCMKQISFSSMGADVADINNDGYPEIFTTDMLPEDDYRLKTLGAFDNVDVYRTKLEIGFYHQFMKNCLQLNNGDGTFSEIANYSKVDATDWSWGALMFDADNDGYNDIFVCNGVNKDVTNLDFMQFFANDVIQKMVLTGRKDKVEEVLRHIPVTPVSNKTYRNKGNLEFEDVGTQWGLGDNSFSNGAAYGDLDNDGDLDLIVNNENQPSFIYRNNSREINGNHYFGLMLKGDSANVFAVGSKIKVYADGQLFFREHIPSRGFQSSMDYKQLIGIGDRSKIDSVIVQWPDLSFSKIENPAVDSVYRVDKSSFQKIQAIKSASLVNSLFDSVPSPFQKHIEDDYVDFYYERNIPEMISREGPRAASADVNGDGLADIYIGGTKGNPGQLYIQTSAGKFQKLEQKVFYQFSTFEDGASIFFDADNDGDQDLFVGPAGNRDASYSREMQCRLLLNDGKGNFSLHASSFPKMGVNVAAVAVDDIDKDGDLDMFVGGRAISGKYGETPQSFIFINDGAGNFRDIAATGNAGIAKAGLITGAVFCDVTGDDRKELVIAGEWMAPRIYSYSANGFEQVKSNLDTLSGWWQRIATADLNGDGKADLVLGNIGENFYLHPGPGRPVKLWMNDFDGNGEIDKLLTRTVDGKDKPVFLKNDLQDQVPGIKKENLKHHDFALKSIHDLFAAEAIDKAVVKEVNYCSSIIALSKGNGQFEIRKLPARGQLSSVNSILCADVNSDGLTDLITGGNKSGFPPQLQKLDASFGDVFINKGKGEFEWMERNDTNLQVDGEVRDILDVKMRNGNYVLFLRNNDFPKMFRLNIPREN